jgi:hypothetical protein
MSRLTASRGLVTSSNELSRADGSLTKADNIVIDLDNVIEQRRGFKEYSQLLGTSPKQLLTYKSQILVHYEDTLAFDNGDGVFTNFTGSYSELDAGLRIKSLEANGNLYFTTSEGIKKISAKTVADISTSTIINAGAAEAVDLSGKVIPEVSGYLPAQSKVSYKLLFGYKDINTNLIRGTPSSRVLLTNFSADVKRSEIFTVNIIDQSLIPSTNPAAYFLFSSIDTDFFVWFKKDAAQITPVTADTFSRQEIMVDLVSTPANNIDVAAALANELSRIAGVSIDISGAEVEVTINTTGDTTDVSAGTVPVGASTITKTFDGSITVGTPAKARLSFTIPPEVDTTYFYQIYRTAVVSVSPGVTLNDIDPGDEHQFVYEAPILDADLLAGEIEIDDDTPENFRQSGEYLYTNAITGQGITQSNDRPPISFDIASFRNSAFYANTKEFHNYQFTMLSVDDFVTSSTKLYISRVGDVPVEYLFVGVKEVTDITVADKSSTTESSYIEINSANNQREYYLWFDKGAGVDPNLTGKTGIRIPLELYPDTIDGSKQALIESLLSINDFTVVDFSASVVRITCEDSGEVTDASTTGSGWSVSIVTQGDGENPIAREVLLSKSSSVGIAIDTTARSLVNVINKDIDSPVTARYLSGVDDLPGKILLKAKSLEDVSFYIAISDATLATEFSPEIPFWDEIATFPITAASDNNEVPNRLKYSKTNQPEAVPIANFIDVGSKDKAILRILPLRDNLFCLKEDGIFLVSGSSAANFNVRLLDNSAILIAPDSAVVLNNSIHCLTTQGIVSISDSGVSIIARAIEDLIKKVTTFRYDYRTAAFGVSYESDRAYFLWLPTQTTDTQATQCFRFSTITNTWTRFTVTANCGINNSLGDDRLYLGGTGRNYILQERKNGERQDYSDRDFIREIGSDSVKGNKIILSSGVDVEVGDVITQEQYICVSKFNRTLRKLDSDDGITDSTYEQNFSAVQGSNLGNIFLALVDQLNADPGLYASFTVPSGLNTAETLRDDFNLIMDELDNISSGTFFKDYTPVVDLLTYEVLITEKVKNSNSVTVDRETWFIQGNVTIFKSILTEVEWAPQHFGKPEAFKQVREGTIIFDQNVISSGTLSYASDQSQDYVDIPFTMNGPGFWASFPWITIPWGGGGNEEPERTLIPQNKARCRYLHVKFKHSNARERYKLLGISLEPREFSTRAYR